MINEYFVGFCLFVCLSCFVLCILISFCLVIVLWETPGLNARRAQIRVDLWDHRSLMDRWEACIVGSADI